MRHLAGQLYQCPSDSFREVPTGPTRQNEAGYNDYAINAELSNANFANTTTPTTGLPEYGLGGISEAAVERSSLTLMVVEGDSERSGSMATYRFNGSQPSLTGSRYDHDYPTVGGTAGGGRVNSSNIIDRHLDGSNFLFVDGHAKFYNIKAGKGQFYRAVMPFSVTGDSPTFHVAD